MALNPANFGRLPATGRAPVTGSLSPTISIPAVFRAQRQQAALLQVSQPYPEPRQQQGSTLPEAPLKPVSFLDPSLVIPALGGVAFLIARQRAIAALTLIRKGALYSGHPGFDVTFWAAYLRYKDVQDIITELSNRALTLPVPDREPVEASGLLQQLLLGHPSQDVLRQKFIDAQILPVDQVEALIAMLKRNRDVGYGPGEKFIDPVAANQLVIALEAGLEARALQEINRAVLGKIALEAQRDLSKQFWGVLFHQPAIHAGQTADP